MLFQCKSRPAVTRPAVTRRPGWPESPSRSRSDAKREPKPRTRSPSRLRRPGLRLRRAVTRPESCRVGADRWPKHPDSLRVMTRPRRRLLLTSTEPVRPNRDGSAEAPGLYAPSRPGPLPYRGSGLGLVVGLAAGARVQCKCLPSGQDDGSGEVLRCARLPRKDPRSGRTLNILLPSQLARVCWGIRHTMIGMGRSRSDH